jgi:hypothetical protein
MDTINCDANSRTQWPLEAGWGIKKIISLLIG